MHFHQSVLAWARCFGILRFFGCRNRDKPGVLDLVLQDAIWGDLTHSATVWLVEVRGCGASVALFFVLVAGSIYYADSRWKQGQMKVGGHDSGRKLFLLKNHHITTCWAEILERFIT